MEVCGSCKLDVDANPSDEAKKEFDALEATNKEHSYPGVQYCVVKGSNGKVTIKNGSPLVDIPMTCTAEGPRMEKG